MAVALAIAYYSSGFWRCYRQVWADFVAKGLVLPYQNSARSDAGDRRRFVVFISRSAFVTAADIALRPNRINALYSCILEEKARRKSQEKK